MSPVSNEQPPRQRRVEPRHVALPSRANDRTLRSNPSEVVFGMNRPQHHFSSFRPRSVGLSSTSQSTYAVRSAKTERSLSQDRSEVSLFGLASLSLRLISNVLPFGLEVPTRAYTLPLRQAHAELMPSVYSYTRGVSRAVALPSSIFLSPSGQQYGNLLCHRPLAFLVLISRCA